MDYDRVRRKGLDNVSAEFMLVCLGYNMRKLFALIEGKGKFDYWIAPDELEPELPRAPDMKKLMRMQPMGKNEALRLSYKHKKRAVASP